MYTTNMYGLHTSLCLYAPLVYFDSATFVILSLVPQILYDHVLTIF